MMHAADDARIITLPLAGATTSQTCKTKGNNSITVALTNALIGQLKAAV
jgi:hypothetical protein